MSKVALIILTMVVGFMLMGSAYALLIDDVNVQGIAKSSAMDVRIVERETSVLNSSGNNASTSVGMPSPMTINDEESTTYIRETINNFVPGEEVKMQYKIVNKGTMDVLLTGVIVTTDNQDLEPLISLKWSISEYDNGICGNRVTNNADGETLDDISSLTNVSNVGITLDNDLGTEDYCLLELVVKLDDESDVVYKTMKTTEFTVTPEYIQN